MNKKTIILLLIVLVASVMRLWQLGGVPASPDWDEAALGYNAYSLLHTGKDEYGEVLPVILKSFGDYKPALYSYLAIPSILIFDLNTFSIRLPSAIFGILSVLATYFFVKELIYLKSKQNKDSNDSSIINHFSLLPLVAAFMLAISPWHIQFSRVAFEANVGMALNLFAATFFLMGLKKPLLLSLSALCLGLGLYAYQSEKVFVPLLFLVLVGVFFVQIRKVSRKFILFALLAGIIVSLPMLIAFVGDVGNTLGRAKGVSVFSSQSDSFKANTEKMLRDKQQGDLIGQLVDNRRVFYARQVVENYLSHWDINWLFLQGDIGRHHAPNMGLLYLIELPLVLVGFYALIFGAYPRRMKLLIFLWLFIAPVPASVTTGVPHAVRDLNVLPMFQVLIALGIVETFLWIKNSSVLSHKSFLYGRKVLYSSFIILYSLNFIYYLDEYFVQQNYFQSQDWQYGYAQAVAETADLAQDYKKIVVSNSGYMDQSYIFFLFYLKYPPEQYQKEMSFIGGGTSDRRIGKYEFRKVDWDKDKDEKTLVVGMPDETPETAITKSKIDFLDGTPAIEIVDGGK